MTGGGGRPAGRAWAYAGALLGGAVSVAANVAHSYVPPAAAAAGWRPQPGAVLGAVFWPVALFVAIETLARTGWPEGLRWLGLRWLGLLPVAAVAAVVSYRHLSGLLAFYGEDALTVRIGPLAVDGLMVVATGALIATARPAVPAGLGAGTGSGAGARGPRRARGQAGAASRPRAAGRVPGTAAAVAQLRGRHPDMPPAEIARRLGVTERTVRRHMASGGAEPASAA